MNIVENVILKHFNSEWAESVYSTVPVAYENQTFDDTPSLTSWVRITCKNSDGLQRSIGTAPNRTWQRFGFVIFEVYIKPNTSTYTGKDIAEEIIDMFEGKNISKVIFNDGTYKSKGVSGKWFGFGGYIKWEYLEQK